MIYWSSLLLDNHHSIYDYDSWAIRVYDFQALFGYLSVLEIILIHILYAGKNTPNYILGNNIVSLLLLKRAKIWLIALRSGFDCEGIFYLDFNCSTLFNRDKLA